MADRTLYIFLDEAGNLDFSPSGTQSVEKAIKVTLAEMLDKKIRYRIMHHSSKSNLDLQIIDYCNWAIQRKWANKDCRSYDLICSAIRSEFEIFKSGEREFY